RASYFNGEIPGVSFYDQWLSTNQLPYNTPVAQTGFISPGLSSAICIDDNHDLASDSTPIQIYTCNQSAAQQWVLTPLTSTDWGAFTIRLASNTAYCWDITN